MPSDEAIEALADQLRTLRKPGQTIRPFLRKNAQLFRDLQEDDWSWSGVALAMIKAGITYETKSDWTGVLLMQAFWRAQRPLKGYARSKSKNAVSNDRIAHSAAPFSPTNSEGPPEVSVEAPSIFTPALVSQSVEPPEQLPKSYAVIPNIDLPPKFKAFSLKSQELPREPTPDEIKDRNAIRKRMFGN